MNCPVLLRDTLKKFKNKVVYLFILVNWAKLLDQYYASIRPWSIGLKVL